MEKFLKKLKGILFALIAASFVVSGFLSNVQAEVKTVNTRHGKEPELVFPVISDVHIKKSGTIDLQKFEDALDQLMSRHQNKMLSWSWVI
jgi:hypothetical protein